MTGLLYIDAAMTAAGAHSWALIQAVHVDPLYSFIYRRFIAEGRHGTMGWAARYQDVRDDPRLLLQAQGGPEVSALLLCLFAYPSPGQAAAVREHAQQTNGNPIPYVADYALAPVDYHRVCLQRLTPVAEVISSAIGATTRVYCDTAPLRERYWAARAGLGFITRNNQLNVSGQGSSFHIAAIAIGADGTSPLPAKAFRRLLPPPVLQCVPGCHRCLEACPTRALRSDGSCDTSRCLSYLTIEAPAPRLPLHPIAFASQRSDSSKHIYGCDICRRVCPLSNPAVCSAVPVSDLTPSDAPIMSLEEWHTLTPSEFKKRFPQSAIQRPGLKRLRRNL